MVEVIESLKNKYPIREMLAFLKIPKSSYYRWRSKPNDKNESELIEHIKEICNKHKRRYGYRRVTAALASDYQLTINHKRVRRIMAENNLQAKIRRKKLIRFKPETVIKKADLIKRQFKADAPN